MLNLNGGVYSEREVREGGKGVAISLSHHHYDDGGEDRDRANDDGDINDSFSPQSVLQLIPFFFARPLFLNLLSQLE